MGIVQQLSALIGVIVGAVASYLVGAGTERARWRREQSARWDDKRAQAYADYGYAIKNVYVQARCRGRVPDSCDRLEQRLERAICAVLPTF